MYYLELCFSDRKKGNIFLFSWDFMRIMIFIINQERKEIFFLPFFFLKREREGRTWWLWCMINNMGEIKVNSFDLWILGGDHAQSGTNSTTNIYKCVYVIKSLVYFQEMFGEDDRMAFHPLIEKLVHPWNLCIVLKSRHAICLVKWNATFQNCVLQIVPVITSWKLFSSYYVHDISIFKSGICWIHSFIIYADVGYLLQNAFAQEGSTFFSGHLWSSLTQFNISGQLSLQEKHPDIEFNNFVDLRLIFWAPI